MSIPPLVCSTPPPPDQCEDDKDPEDFELSYSLSQEDDEDGDDNGFNYGNFSAYNNYQSTSDNKPLEIKQHEITESTESRIQKEIFLNYQNVKEAECVNASEDVFTKNDINENKLKCDEDLSIEDLNLKVEEEIDSINESNNSLHSEIIESDIVTVKEYHISSNINNESPTCDNITVPTFDENAIDVKNSLKEVNTNFVEQVDTSCNEIPVELQTELDQALDNVAISGLKDIKLPQQDSELNGTYKLEETSISLEDSIEPIAQSSKIETKSEEKNLDDDFGDFDDFQSVLNTKSNVASVVGTSNNPWENAESNESDFTATFEDSKFQVADNFTVVKTQSISNNPDQVINEPIEADNNLDNENDDDFGDFDDFKSSSVKAVPKEFTVEDTSYCQELPVLNLQSAENEHQIMESITKVLSSVFLEEISEPENGFEGTLESLLSETWGHLMETDERQPYIVNWNNSLGQKTLLKALCIDSRNILFGPKWSSNMPKYAANLSNAPLQPQKQASVPSSIVTQSEILAEKPPSKLTTWTDPFTSDGQESCNNDNENAAVTSGPADLDVFEPAVSTKSDKIYSNTIGVQPLRQINLPDTHIFTPTDSEIPRSKTIHYDSPSTHLSQPYVANNKNEMDTVNTSNVNSIENSINDTEYWDFQNFQRNSESNSLPLSNSQQENNLETATTVNALPKPNIAYQTDLLQPIKVELAKPTLNWPDPGEIKGGFDDFSDFVSISSQSIEKQDSIHPVESLSEINKLDNVTISHDSTKVTGTIKPDIDGFDDDFDTFQSALPSKSVVDNFKTPYLDNTINQVTSSQIPEIGSQNIDSIKSFGNIFRPNEALTQNLGHVSNNTELTKSSLPSGTHIPSNILQPTPASFTTANTQNKQKSGQILQPLSLESYSQINWPSPGIDLQDLSRFNPVETLNSLKSDLSASGPNKGSSPVHVAKTTVVNQIPDDDVWGEFVSSKPKQQSQLKKPPGFADDDEWTDFISSPSVKPQNGLNTISLNVHTNSNIQKSVQNKFAKKIHQPPLDIPTLNYVTPKANSHKSYNDKHFQNL